MWRSLIVTDVTEMRGGHFCVAGWDTAAKAMCRPLLGPGHDWVARHVGPRLLWPGNRMGFETRAARPGARFPHATEDAQVAGTGMRIGAATANWLDEVRDSLSSDLPAVFGGAVQFRRGGGLHYHVNVPPDARVPSLGAVALPGDALGFEAYEGRLRARLTDRAATWQLPVVAHALRAAYRDGGLPAVRNAGAGGAVHVRLGLARPFGDPPDECYVMVNGVYPL